MTRAVRVRVSGQVQGVAFRAYAAQEATRLQISGWVLNEPDGSVALYVEGDADAVEAMIEWCRSGSPSARVADVEVDDADLSAAAGGPGSFEVRY